MLGEKYITYGTKFKLRRIERHKMSCALSVAAIIPFLGLLLIRYIKLTSHAITSSFIISCSNSLSVLFFNCAIFSSNTFVELLNIYFFFNGLGTLSSFIYIL